MAVFVQLFGCFQQRVGLRGEHGKGAETAPLSGMQRAHDAPGGGCWPTGYVYPGSAHLLAGPLLTFAGQRTLTVGLSRRLRRACLNDTPRLTAENAAKMVISLPPTARPLARPGLM